MPKFRKGHKSWNKGLSAKTDKRVKKYGERIKGNKNALGRKHTPKEIKKMSRNTSVLWEDKEYVEKHLGAKNPMWKGGLMKNSRYLNWLKNRREFSIETIIDARGVGQKRALL